MADKTVTAWLANDGNTKSREGLTIHFEKPDDRYGVWKSGQAWLCVIGSKLEQLAPPPGECEPVLINSPLRKTCVMCNREITPCTHRWVYQLEKVVHVHEGCDLEYDEKLRDVGRMGAR